MITGGFTMKQFLLHFSLAVAVSIMTLALAPSVHAQQAGQDPAPAAAQPQSQAQMPSSSDTTHEDKAFTGRIVKENGDLVLKDPVSKVTYKLSDPAKAKQFVGKQVKVTGKLDTNTNTIEVGGIEPLS
jgi:uncharacterized protein YdeI (BOF family)